MYNDHAPLADEPTAVLRAIDACYPLLPP
jgi:hypothetical protein